MSTTSLFFNAYSTPPPAAAPTPKRQSAHATPTTVQNGRSTMTASNQAPKRGTHANGPLQRPQQPRSKNKSTCSGTLQQRLDGTMHSRPPDAPCRSTNSTLPAAACNGTVHRHPTAAPAAIAQTTLCSSALRDTSNQSQKRREWKEWKL